MIKKSEWCSLKSFTLINESDKKLQKKKFIKFLAFHIRAFIFSQKKPSIVIYRAVKRAYDANLSFKLDK